MVERNIERPGPVGERAGRCIPDGDLHAGKFPFLRPARSRLIAYQGLAARKPDNVRGAHIHGIRERFRHCIFPHLRIRIHRNFPEPVQPGADRIRLELSYVVVLYHDHYLVSETFRHRHPVPVPLSERHGHRLPAPCPASVTGLKHGNFLLIRLPVRILVSEIDLHPAVRKLQERRLPATIPETRSRLIQYGRFGPGDTAVLTPRHDDGIRIYVFRGRPVIATAKQCAVGERKYFSIGYIDPDIPVSAADDERRNYGDSLAPGDHVCAPAEVDIAPPVLEGSHIAPVR